MEGDPEHGLDPISRIDPVCGSALGQENGETFFDGTYLFSFCCAMCRRIFIDEWRRRRKAERERSSATVH